MLITSGTPNQRLGTNIGMLQVDATQTHFICASKLHLTLSADADVSQKVSVIVLPPFVNGKTVSMGYTNCTPSGLFVPLEFNPGVKTWIASNIRQLPDCRAH